MLDEQTMKDAIKAIVEHDAAAWSYPEFWLTRFNHAC